tara:strand:- start:162 stop:422 length:261 start_codon:yes stop_codon:yes gene_type:complete
MSIWVPIACSAVILIFSVSLLRASGVWTQIFAPRDLRPKDTFDPLVAAPYGWIENHVFWDNVENEIQDAADISMDFWNEESESFAS